MDIEKCLLTNEEALARTDEYWELYRELWNEGIIDEADFDSAFDYWKLEAQLLKAIPLISSEIKKELEKRCPHAPRNFPSDKRMCVQCWQDYWRKRGVK